MYTEEQLKRMSLHELRDLLASGLHGAEHNLLMRVYIEAKKTKKW